MNVPNLLLVAAVVFSAAAVAQWAGFALGRTVGEYSILTIIVAAFTLAWLVGRSLWRNGQLAALIALGAGVCLCLLNYAFLYWLRVVHLREIDAGLFHYFGSVYGLGVEIIAVVCGVIGFVSAWLKSRTLRGMDRSE